MPCSGCGSTYNSHHSWCPKSDIDASEVHRIEKLERERMKHQQLHGVDGNMVTVDAETCYKILAGTQVWLAINGKDKPMITSKTVVYTDEDLRQGTVSEYHFHLPSNDKQAKWLIAKKDDVKVFERVRM